MEIICANKLCRKVFDFKGGKAHFKRAKHHYCSTSCQNTIHGLAGTKRHQIWEQAKKRAKIKGINFELTVHDMPEIPKRCPILGIEIIANSIAGPLDTSPSLDRIDSMLGYIKSNIRIISNRANRIRSDAAAKELRLLADDIEKSSYEDDNIVNRKIAKIKQLQNRIINLEA